MPAQAIHDRVVLAHGGGGELTARLLRRHVLPALLNPQLAPLADSAVMPWPSGELVFTTDSYVVTPLEFPGGDIGRLAVAGTVNDLAVMGAEPVALSLALVLEEGLPMAVLDRVVASIAATAREAGVPIVTGDTKVIERRRTGDLGPENTAAAGVPEGGGPIREGMFINTAGVGRLRPGVRLDVGRVAPGDRVLINGTLGDHGLAVMSVRSGLEFESTLRSDAAPLNSLIATLLDSGADIKFLRDPTRGGVAGVLADVSETAGPAPEIRARATREQQTPAESPPVLPTTDGLSIEIEEARLPINATARHAAEMLGFDLLTVANEGKVIAIVAPADADRALAALRSHPLGRDAAIIGRITATQPALVELITRAGGRRIVQRPYGEDLPRIC